MDLTVEIMSWIPSPKHLYIRTRLCKNMILNDIKQHFPLRYIVQASNELFLLGKKKERKLDLRFST